jgi:hypothetical protein
MDGAGVDGVTDQIVVVNDRPSKRSGGPPCSAVQSFHGAVHRGTSV